ncbi:MAG TPA: aspartate aminotransferase family protein [Actinobacteria bacterium]|nr:aspartate aminotransferase family protein [Actinomycetota bacterium]
MTIGAFLHPFAPPARPRDEFVTIVEGRGAVVTDDRGRSYIDAMASLWYCNVGYGRRELVEAITAQAERIAGFHTFTSFTNEPAETLAERIVDLSPFDEARVFLCQSGSEAVDTAMKLARVAHVRRGRPHRRILVSRGRGYHGVNYGGTSLSGIPVNREGFEPFVEATVVVDPDDPGKLEATLEAYPGEVAAVIVEPVQGASGVWPPPEGYLAAVRELCDAHGAFLVFDEVITGFGRLGTWFAAQRYGVTPDMITFAKAVTSGYVPLAGVIVGPSVRRALEEDDDFVLRHGYTYSGHPLAAACALANLDLIEREGLLDRVPGIETRLGGGLRDLADEGRIAAARGVGGMWAAAMPDGVAETQVAARMLERGVIARPVPGTIVFCPPLVITDAELDRVVDALATALGT